MQLLRCVPATSSWSVRLATAILVLSASVLPAHAGDLEQWLTAEKNIATTKLLKNILSNGAVVASPDNAHPNDPCHQDYYYHWVRDGSLVMDMVVSMYWQASDPAERSRYLGLLTRYIDFSMAIQNTNNLSSGMGRGLGEPKFNTDGSPYSCNWGRPQDDGPALRAISLCRLATRLLDDGSPELSNLVRTKLYDGILPTNSLIKKDLEYISHNWSSPCVDLWEESYGNHFYTSIVQRRALKEGATLAARLGDAGAASWYSAQATLLETAIRGHWDSTNGFLRATLNQNGPKDQNGKEYKTSGLDVAVVLGVLHAHADRDDFFAPTDDQVLSTVRKLVARFAEDGFYLVNKTKQDAQGGLLGTAVGRYPEDKYDPTDNSGKGNPWFICTAAIGELYYRAANSLDAKGSLVVSQANKGLLSSLDSTKFSSLQLGQTLSRNDSQFADVLATLRSAGDAQLRRIKYHADADGALSEQYDRNDGHEKSFRDLTWSYASLLTAVDKRRTDTALHSSQPRPILDFKPNPSALISGSRERPFLDPSRAPDRNGSRSSTFPSARPWESQQSATLLYDRLRISPAPLYAQPLNRIGIPMVSRRTESTPTSHSLDGGNERAAKTLEELSRRLSELERAVEGLSKQQRADRPEKQK